MVVESHTLQLVKRSTKDHQATTTPTKRKIICVCLSFCFFFKKNCLHLKLCACDRVFFSFSFSSLSLSLFALPFLLSRYEPSLPRIRCYSSLRLVGLVLHLEDSLAVELLFLLLVPLWLCLSHTHTTRAICSSTKLVKSARTPGLLLSSSLVVGFSHACFFVFLNNISFFCIPVPLRCCCCCSCCSCSLLTHTHVHPTRSLHAFKIVVAVVFPAVVCLLFDSSLMSWDTRGYCGLKLNSRWSMHLAFCLGLLKVLLALGRRWRSTVDFDCVAHWQKGVEADQQRWVTCKQCVHLFNQRLNVHPGINY